MTTAATYPDPTTPAEFSDAYQEVSTQLAGKTEATALTVFAAWQAGNLTDLLFTVRLAAVIVTANRLGILAGDALTVTRLGIAGRNVAPAGLGIPDWEAEATRLTKAVNTLTGSLDTTGDPKGRVSRFARSEPVQALQDAMVRAYAAHGVTGYRRHTDADPCELCVWLKHPTAEQPEGRVYAMTKSFYSHPGCQCEPEPVTD